MASRAKVRGGEKQQQSLSLGRETVEELEKEAERRGLNKSQLADLLLNGQLTQSADKPTIISIMSYKGGVAKTTTSTCLAVCLSELGYKVLVIDMDGQGNVSQSLGVYDPRSEEACIADVLYQATPSSPRMSLSEVMRTTDYENVFCVPSNFRFADADTRLKAEIAGGVDTRLLYAIEDLIDETARSGERKFDYIIIDCGPRLDMTTTNAIVALETGNNASHIIIPIKVDGYAIAGLSQTIDTINRTARERRRLPQHWKILQTMIERNTSAYKYGCQMMKEAIPNAEYFNTKIEKSTVVPEASLAMEPLIKYDPNSKPAISYRLLAQEIEEMNA